MGFCEILTLIFVVLKLCHVVAWPWLYVFAPVIIECVLTLVITGGVLLVAGLVAYLGSR